jgi:phosphatidylglycerol phospholipase C
MSARHSPEGSRPQAIAHRGYRAAFPENTMAAFKGAVKVGAHAIETDIHLTKDGVVVLSHVRCPSRPAILSYKYRFDVTQDPTLQRCFGKKDRIIDLEWREIESLRTIQAPGEPMPRLKDLLKYLSEPGLEDIWVLLDIKVGHTLQGWKPSGANFTADRQ